MVAQAVEPGPIDKEKAETGDEDGLEHPAGGRRADEEAVEQEGREAHQGDGQRPVMKLSRGRDDFSLVGEQAQKTLPARSIEQREGHSHAQPPDKEAAYRAAEGGHVARAVEASAERLAGIGKAVHHVGEEGEELHEQRVDGQDDVALTRSRGSEKHRRGHEAKRTQEDVAVHLEEAVPRAMPSTFMSSRKTKERLAAMLTTFCVMAMNMGKREFCIPMNHPEKL